MSKALEPGFTRCEYEYILARSRNGKNVLIDFGDKQEWLPASQVTIDEEEKTVTMPDWLYKVKAL